MCQFINFHSLKIKRLKNLKVQSSIQEDTYHFRSIMNLVKKDQNYVVNHIINYILKYKKKKKKKKLMKKFAVTFLLDKKNNWISNFIDFKDLLKVIKNIYFKISTRLKYIENQDIVFPINFTKILPGSFLKKNKLTLIVHSSDLPKDKGFAPLSNQILKGKNHIFFNL